MALILHRATRADTLAQGLTRMLRTPLPDPFATELVLVPAKGVERWLSQRLSHGLGHAPGGQDGVCAGVEMRSPASLVAELVGASSEGHPDPWSPDALVWPLLETIDRHAGEPWCRPLGLHLGLVPDSGTSGATPAATSAATSGATDEQELRRGRRYSVARRLARLFASYAVQRPQLLAAWETAIPGAGDAPDLDGAGGTLDPDLAWQAELWRRLLVTVAPTEPGAAPSPVARHAQVCAALRAGEVPAGLPPRLSLFGHTRLPPTEIELLGALGEHREVHLWLPHASPGMWRHLAGPSGPGGPIGPHGAVPRDLDASGGSVRHPLLASLGRDLRELQRALGGVAVEDLAPSEDEQQHAPAPSLLARLQADLVADRAPAPGPLAADDRSVQVHACHGPARQVEVLREVIVGLLEDDPTLEPRDVVVMCPDIEVYAPLVTAAFGMDPAAGRSDVDRGGAEGGHPGQRLRVRLADRALTQTNPLLDVVRRLLDLAGGRAEASAVLDLVSTGPVSRRFGFTEDDLETIARWVQEAGIRWAFDAAHRADYGLDAYLQNTWRFGLDRILTGAAVSDDADRFFGTTLPLDDVGSTGIDLAGRLAEVLERVEQVTEALSGTQPIAAWLEAVARAVDTLTVPARGEEWQVAQAHRELGATLQASGGSDLRLRLPDVRALMAERLAGRPTRANFRTGTLTVCTLTPMRSVPHRVVCLLGLDDGAFPRAGALDGDDVLARRPMTGERDLRSEDRQLLLDAVLAATEHLVVTYTGANETTGRPRPPAVPLGELLDTLAAMAPDARSQVLSHHPLQAFDPRNFEPGSPRSFDVAALAGARAAAGARTPEPRLADVWLPAPSGDVELEELTRFLAHPVREFLRRRLEVVLPEELDEVGDAMPVDLDGLGQWQVGERLLADLLRGRTVEQARDKEWRRGVLPPGRLGWTVARQVGERAEPVADLVESIRAGAPVEALDVDVDLGGGRRLRGTVTDVFGTRVVRHSYSRLGPRHHLQAWVPLLSLCATRPGRGWSAGSVGRGRYGSQPTARAAFASVAPDDAVELLRDLVALYDQGQRGPLPLPLRTAHAWAGARPAARRAKADQAWARDRFSPEREDPAHARVWGSDAPLDVLLAPPRPGEAVGLGEHEDTRLGALAARLWQPVLQRARG